MAVSPALGVDLCTEAIGEPAKHCPNFCVGIVMSDKKSAVG
jgi:hypothetical protein